MGEGWERSPPSFARGGRAEPRKRLPAAPVAIPMEGISATMNRMSFWKFSALLLLTAALALSPPAAPAEAGSPVSVQVTTSSVIGKLDPKLWANIGYDPMYSSTVSDDVLPVWKLFRETGAFRYIRMHNTFSDGLAQAGLRANKLSYCGTRIYSEDAAGKPRYDFSHLDEVLDTLLSAGLRPILEADFMPDDLAEGPLSRNYCGGLVNTPKDYPKWRDLIYRTVRHLEERYGADEVRRWYFEIWNEPDLKTYFIGGAAWGVKITPDSLASFNKMYDYFADGAKAADPKVKVGGPGLAGRPEFFRAFLTHVTRETNFATGAVGSPIDFVSWHHYGEIEGMLQSNRDRIADVREFFPSGALPELQQNEWGQPLKGPGMMGAPQQVFGPHDTVFLTRMVAETLARPDSRVGLFLRWGQPGGPLVNGRNPPWRALSFSMADTAVPFPILNAYLMLAKLGGDQVAFHSSDDGVGGFAARSAPSDVQVVLYRAEGAGNLPVSVSVTLPKGLKETPVTEYLIDEDHGNARKAWETISRMEAPLDTRIKMLEEAARLKPAAGPSKLKVKNGVARFELEMAPDSLALLVFGNEAVSTPKFSPHIRRVIKGEEQYMNALALERSGQTTQARTVFEAVARDFSDLFWSRRALLHLLTIAKSQGKPADVDAICERLLKTDLDDPDLLDVLKQRRSYLMAGGKTGEAQALDTRIQEVEARLNRFKTWSSWSKFP